VSWGHAPPSYGRLVTGVRVLRDRVRFALADRARVTIRITRRGRDVRRVQRTLSPGRRSVRLRVPRGARVRVTARAA